MYFPIGWPKYLKETQRDSPPLQYVISNCDRMLFAVLSEDTLSIWYCKPTVQIVNYTQSQRDLACLGGFCLAEWKPDSSMIAVMTTKQHVMFFKVDLDISVANHHCLYVQQEGRAHPSKQDLNGIPDSDSVPAIKLTAVFQLKLSSQITWCLCVREELVVATADGCLNRVKWNGTLNAKARLVLQDIPVSLDFQKTKAARLTAEDGHVVHMEYSPIIGGYIMVLSSGRGLFVMPPSSRVDNSVAQGVWIQDLKDATCLCVNHRYRLMAFGCCSGHGHVYVINELEGTLELSHKLTVSSRDYPDAAQTAGAVRCLKWTPDGTAMAMCWRNGGFSLWSVFGSLLVCSLGGDYCFPNDGVRLFPPPVRSLEWGLEGYQLWMVCETVETELEGYVGYHGHRDMSHIMQLQFVKSALTVNPCMANHEHVFLQGEDKLYMNTSDVSQKSTSRTESHLLVGNKHWQIIPISHSYLATNWPIRYAAVDRSGQYLAVAGKTGLAHYNFLNRKWKLFGNETQERDLVVSGGMAWWKDFICVACYNIVGQRDEIKCYPRSCKLDNTFAISTKVPSQVLLLNTFRDILIVFCIDSHIMLYNMERKNTQSNPLLDIVKVQEVSLNNYVPHPVCVTGLALTSLKTEYGTRSNHNNKEAESLLLSVAGKLLMFQRDVSGPQVKDQKSNQTKHKPPQFCPPSVVATNVENMWTTSRANQGKMQLMEALWLGCGAQGMKVWLPLYPRDETKTLNFMSKRIMLPFRVDIYPLAVLFEDAVILGAAGDALTYQYSSPSDASPMKPTHYLPFCILERTSQIYLHHILRQLLRRNLGVNALDLARSCTELSYFPHVLELLLHEVLEAEATSKEPIPDPLLPRIVAFIQEFPEFLQTVVHCARKTEVALWPYLFSSVGNPKDLFQECLINGKLETAASYLIILQNLEKPIISRQHATLLLDSSLDKGKWDLARDLVRFLKAIDPSDVDSPTNLSLYGRAAGYSSPPISPPDADGFSFTNVSNVSNINRVRSSSVTSTDLVQNVKVKEKLKHTVSDNPAHGRRMSPKPKDDSTADQVYIDVILCRHCRRLVETNRMRDMGYFAANMEDFQLVSWLKRERLRAAKVEDFVTALRDLHQQFQWPFPILSYSAFQQLKNKTFSTSSLASVSLLEEEIGNEERDVSAGEKREREEGGTYNQYLGTTRQGPNEQNLSHSLSDDIFLRPQISHTEESSLATMEVSDNSSLLGEFEYLADVSSCTEPLSPELEILSQEMANKGPMQSELELRYLLQISLEAGCLEWALIFSILLRDALAVVRTVNTASMTDTPLEIIARMREGLSYLELWSDTECLGYKPFLHAIRGQIQVLNKLVEQTAPTLQLSTTPIESSPLDEGQISPVLQAMRTMDIDNTVENDTESKVKEEKSSDCVVS
ncbi:RAB6A-GEF complex partner protein 1-like [Pecten maximus]|uniref:RAB6A-GEF complex partner protein 1-like n=1 Tax=Pecten maximus TaxID=6579 RepID=UPI0014587BFA|nr:RAB6A-GEF complex partner protein 1-like [Pecten maximus]XP_033737684.1 RAB6A-GEF complex partner protein 1-like [Pecten maximus]XP_033737685.1 RAB6A-GEF complex partner protein 1-like [Pecten maximus]XP_033737686.1 RAB6A-GEF complex partner protein 1-like [Pecten maximus]XP_033737687.1 RAB6A-GEF complex partner protein 1-like [Pecten maximus]XP_033737688.1 RAB6A-GEF complex partner protein 1-like [Pecten maximus]